MDKSTGSLFIGSLMSTAAMPTLKPSLTTINLEEYDPPTTTTTQIKKTNSLVN